MTGITEQSMVHLTGKDDWGTPKKWVDYIAEKYAKCKFAIDACASDYNHKVDFYITKEMDLFKHQLDQPFFMNPIYGKKGWHTVFETFVDAYGKIKFLLDNKGKRIKVGKFYNEYGTEDFLKYAHYQHFKHNVTGAVLLFANISSSQYFAQVVGESPVARMHNECELFFPPERIEFENEFGKSVGTPSLASMVVVYDERFGVKK